MTTANILSQLGSAGVSTAFKNRIFNGAMQVWQRGTSFTSVANALTAPQYTADRMFGYRGSGWAANLDISQQTGFGAYQYCLRAQRTSGTSSTAVMVVGQIVESVNMYDLQGQNVTLSFYCRAGSNFSGGTVSPQVYTSTAANQTSASLAAGTWTGSAVTATNVTPTTTATQYTFTTTIPSNALSLAVIFVWTPSGTAGTNDYLDFSGIQLEVGTTATNFDYRPYGTELALCQRYYWTTYGVGTVAGTSTVNGALAGLASTTSSGALPLSISLPVSMRIAPTVTSYSLAGTSGNNSTNGSYATAGATDRVVNSVYSSPNQIVINAATGSLNGYYVFAQATASAEL